MIILYPIFKKAALFLTIGISSSLLSLAQNCGPIVETFDGTMAGFTSSTQGSPDPGFTPGSQGQNFFLQRCNIPAQGTTYQITTTTYTTSPSQTDLGFGFELSGNALASSAYFFLDYFNTVTGSYSSVYIAATNVVYTGNIATICLNVPFSSIQGFVAGGSYRLNIFLVADAASNNNQCIQFDNFRTTGTASQIILPVSFTGIAARKSGNNVVIVWNVGGEKEVSHYEVERSSDARNYKTIGEVPAAGKSAYSYTDAASGSGVVYYRVRNVDIDGKFSYSNVVRLNQNKIVKLAAYPQPVIDEVTIEHSVTATGKIVIASTTGQLVKTVQVKAGDSQTKVNVSALQSGLYVVRFENGQGDVESIKILKQ